MPNPIDRQSMKANTDRMLSMIDSAVAGSAPFLPVQAGRLPRVRARGADLRNRARAARQAGRRDPERAHRPVDGQGARARRLHPERLDARGGPALAGRRVQHDVPDRPRGHPVQVPEGQPLDSVRGPQQPARPARLRRAAVSGRRHADRPDWLRHLLRLALSRSAAAAGRQRRRDSRPGLGVHGSVGRHRAR